MLDAILLTKLANDSGFELELGQDLSWTGFGVPGRSLRVWLKSEGPAIDVAISRSDILAELGFSAASSSGLPTGSVGRFMVDTPQALVLVLQRARALDRTLPHAMLELYQATVASIDSTEAIATVRQRRGQEIFRRGLMEYWQGRCAITRLDVPELLRASHAKPWKDATDAERLDVHNGLLLAAHLDAAFDQGLIAIAPGGVVIVSERLNGSSRAVLGLNEPRQVCGLRSGHLPFLAWHRERVFEP